MAGLTAIVIVLIGVGGIVTIALGYQQVQRHRADAVALAGYRRLAMEAVEIQAAVRDRLAALEQRLTTAEVADDTGPVDRRASATPGRPGEPGPALEPAL
jgi:hypothetical protein